MADIFTEIKEAIPFESIVKFYGLSTTKGNFCVCPFHGDNHPSMKIYKDHGYCFACNTYVDGPKLVARLFGLSLLESAKKIASDFGIKYDQRSQKAYHEAKILAVKKAEEIDAVNEMADSITRMFYVLHKWEQEYSPSSPRKMKKADTRYLLSLTYKDFLGQLLDDYVEALRDHDAAIQWLREMQSLKELYVLGCSIKNILDAMAQHKKRKKRRKKDVYY